MVWDYKEVLNVAAGVHGAGIAAEIQIESVRKSYSFFGVCGTACADRDIVFANGDITKREQAPAVPHQIQEGWIDILRKSHTFGGNTGAMGLVKFSKQQHPASWKLGPTRSPLPHPHPSLKKNH